MSDIREISLEFKKFNEMFLKLKGDYRFSRLGKTFETKNNKYFLDSGTGKVFQVEDNVYKVLENLAYKDSFESVLDLDMDEDELFGALDVIKTAVEKDSILMSPIINNMEHNDMEYLREGGFPISQVTFELTERCNLRCKYCVYQDEQGGFRTFGENDMTIDTIKSVIDMLAKSSKDEVFVTFYGGEPLLRFDLLKGCIDYCKERLVHKKVSYNLTTNATLINDEIAEYIASLGDHFTTVSIDGPKDIHDDNRVFCNGDGTFDKTISGLKKLIKAEGENAKENININSVLAKKDTQTFDVVQKFFNNQEWLPKGIEISTSYVDKGDVEFEYLGVDTESDLNFTKNNIEPFGVDAIDPLKHWYFNQVNDTSQNLKSNNIISKSDVDRGLHSIHSRMITDKPIPRYWMNGCCTPASRRLYVTVDGNFKLCEKMGPSPSIGNASSGIDLNKIDKYYIKDYINETKKLCNDCWAIRLCSLCYLNCYDEEGVHMSYRHLECLFNRRAVEQNLKKYHEILETNPESLNYLNDIFYS